jgi:CBS domain-containing protein
VSRSLPVIDNENKVIGVISIGDVVKSIIKDKELLITGLENYILGQEHEQ